MHTYSYTPSLPNLFISLYIYILYLISGVYGVSLSQLGHPHEPATGASLKFDFSSGCPPGGILALFYIYVGSRYKWWASELLQHLFFGCPPGGIHALFYMFELGFTLRVTLQQLGTLCAQKPPGLLGTRLVLGWRFSFFSVAFQHYCLQDIFLQRTCFWQIPSDLTNI